MTPRPPALRLAGIRYDTCSTMKCWICGDDANSGEHMIKASDLKSLFGHVTQQAPLYLHTDQKRNLRVAGIKSDKLMYKSLLCSRCNNERTQPYDRAWERLSSHLRERQPPIRPEMRISLTRAFPGSVKKSMTRVHLFFLKLFGCLIAENNIPIKLEQFARSILQGTPHPQGLACFWDGSSTFKAQTCRLLRGGSGHDWRRCRVRKLVLRYRQSLRKRHVRRTSRKSPWVGTCVESFNHSETSSYCQAIKQPTVVCLDLSVTCPSRSNFKPLH